VKVKWDSIMIILLKIRKWLYLKSMSKDLVMMMAMRIRLEVRENKCQRIYLMEVNMIWYFRFYKFSLEIERLENFDYIEIGS